MNELQDAIDLYLDAKPDVVFTHTCPSEVAKILCAGIYHGSSTENALQTMWREHKPSTWVFGHWHQSWRRNVLGTDFVCLNANEPFVLPKCKKDLD